MLRSEEQVDECPFATSGHSGQPVTWWRTAQQIDAEIRLVLGTAATLPRRVISFVTTRHLYGYLFAKRFPEQCGIPVVEAWHDFLSLPVLDSGERVLIVAVPGAWQAIKRMLPQRLDVGDVMILHSAGIIPAEAKPLVDGLAVRGARVEEILGSTETGAVAKRRHDGTGRAFWRLMDDVEIELSGAGEQLLRVLSPRIGRRSDMEAPPASWETPDVIIPENRREFVFVGRNTRLLKINGVKCDLGVIEDRARATGAVGDVACVAYESAIRGEHYDLYYCSVVPDLAAQDVRGVIQAALKDLPRPRNIWRVERIPRGDLGKVRFAELAAAGAQVEGFRRQTHFMR